MSEGYTQGLLESSKVLEITRTREQDSFCFFFNLSNNYSELKRILPLVMVEPERESATTFLSFLSPPLGMLPVLQNF